MRTINLRDIETIAHDTATEFRHNVGRAVRRGEKRRIDPHEFRRISAEIEQTIIRLLEEYIRDYEAIRDRESLIPMPIGVRDDGNATAG